MKRHKEGTKKIYKFLFSLRFVYLLDNNNYLSVHSAI